MGIPESESKWVVSRVSYHHPSVNTSFNAQCETTISLITAKHNIVIN